MTPIDRKSNVDSSGPHIGCEEYSRLSPPGLFPDGVSLFLGRERRALMTQQYGKEQLEVVDETATETTQVRSLNQF